MPDATEPTMPARTAEWLADAARRVGARRKLREVAAFLRSRDLAGVAALVEAHCADRPGPDPEAVDLGTLPPPDDTPTEPAGRERGEGP